MRAVSRRSPPSSNQIERFAPADDQLGASAKDEKEPCFLPPTATANHRHCDQKLLPTCSIFETVPS
jgi:hypothetical protein